MDPRSRRFPSLPHVGGSERLEGFEGFAQVFPMFGTTVNFRVFEFSFDLALQTPTELTRIKADGDMFVESIWVGFRDPNRLYSSPIQLKRNNGLVPIPSDLLPTLPIGNGIEHPWMLNMFLKKGDTLIVEVSPGGWSIYEGETVRVGAIIFRTWNITI